jgi:hypothetical protein
MISVRLIMLLVLVMIILMPTYELVDAQVNLVSIFHHAKALRCCELGVNDTKCGPRICGMGARK